MTASILFAGIKHNPGIDRCYYCGASCDKTYRSKEFVKETFTNRDIVKFPGSEFICSGCVESLGLGADEMEMIDGSIKKRENQRGMAPRMYSWVITKDKRLAATKAHISFLRNVILNPPNPPFVIVLSDSGQKQLIFRAPVALSRDYYLLLLEDQKIEVDIEEFKRRLIITTQLCAATGKPALLGELGMNAMIRVEEYFGSTEVLESWLKIREQPLSRLAAWLSPAKEDAQHEYPSIKRD